LQPKIRGKFEHLLYTLYLYNVIMSYIVGQNEPIDSETDLNDLRFGISFDVRAIISDSCSYFYSENDDICNVP
jgi:hypothetical protein